MDGLWSYSYTYSPKGKWGHQGVREPGSTIQNQSGPGSLPMYPLQSQGSLLPLKGLPLADSQKGKMMLPLLLPYTQ